MLYEVITTDLVSLAEAAEDFETHDFSEKEAEQVITKTTTSLRLLKFFAPQELGDFERDNSARMELFRLAYEMKDKTFREVWDVITSYSIHYTKLYEWII